MSTELLRGGGLGEPEGGDAGAAPAAVDPAVVTTGCNAETVVEVAELGVETAAAAAAAAATAAAAAEEEAPIDVIAEAATAVPTGAVDDVPVAAAPALTAAAVAMPVAATPLRGIAVFCALMSAVSEPIAACIPRRNRSSTTLSAPR